MSPFLNKTNHKVSAIPLFLGEMGISHVINLYWIRTTANLLKNC